jgi:tetratricopeptide (TPR) repeat protein
MTDDSFDFSLDLDLSSAYGRHGDARVHDVLDLLRDRKSAEALDIIEELKAEQGATPLVRHLIALAIVRMGRAVPAIRLLEGCHEEQPEAFEHVEVLAALLTTVGKRTQGIYYAKLSTALKRHYPDYGLVPDWLITFNFALFNAEEAPIADHGFALLEDGSYERAVEHFVDSVDIDRADSRGWRGLIEVNRLRGRHGDALRAAEALSELEADRPETLLTLARCALGIGQVERAWDSVNRALTAAGPDPAVARALPGLVRYDPEAPASLMLQLSEAWEALAAIEPMEVTAWPRENDEARFRLGVISGSMCAHSEHAALLSTLEEAIGRASHLCYYSNLGREDSVSRRMRRSAAIWRDISRIDDETVAAIIRNDSVQILIDLDGYDWGGRPGVVALCPAPVVLCAMATPGAVPGASNGVLALGEPGLPGFEPEREGGVSLDAGLSTWPLYIEPPDVEHDAHSEDGPVRILMDAPAGRLQTPVLKVLSDAVRLGMAGLVTLRGDDPEDVVAGEIVAERAAAAGLDIASMRRLGPSQELSELVAEADLLVDTLPVPSVDAAFEALRRGVPVLTCAPAKAENGAVASLLRCLGLEAWIARDEADMAQRLSALAGDPAALRAERKAVREAVSRAASLEARLSRGQAFARLFDSLLEKAGESS